MTGLLIEISLPDLCVHSVVQCGCLSALCVDPRSRAMCLFVKQMGYNILMSFNVNNWPLAPQSKEVSSDSNCDVSTDQHSIPAVKKRWLGGDHAHLKGLETRDGCWFLQTRTVFVCIQNRLIFHAYIHFKTLIRLLKYFHEFFRHNKTFFSYYKFLEQSPTPHPT